MIVAQDDGVNYEDHITASQYILIEQLLSTSVFDEEQRASFALGVDDITQDEVQTVIDYLYQNQLNPITHKGYYSQTEARKYIKKKCNED